MPGENTYFVRRDGTTMFSYSIAMWPARLWTLIHLESKEAMGDIDQQSVHAAACWWMPCGTEKEDAEEI
jgi:hypothetical protein